MSWRSYSPDFEDAYERRFKSKIEGESTFEKMVDKLEEYLRPRQFKRGEKQEHLSRPQKKALAYEIKEDGLLEETSLKTEVKDKRTKKGYRIVYKDIITGRFAKNPNKRDK